MSTKIEATQNDCLYDLNFTLQDADGVDFDLNQAVESRFKVQHEDDDELKIDIPMSPVEGSIVKHTVESSDFDRAGTYYAEIQVTINTGQIITWSDIIIVVTPDLPK